MRLYGLFQDEGDEYYIEPLQKIDGEVESKAAQLLPRMQWCQEFAVSTPPPSY